MSNRGVKRVMTQAIDLIFQFLKKKERVQIWLFENTSLKIEGTIVGFDEYMNVVLDDAEELIVKTNVKKSLGRIMLKGDTITLIQSAEGSASGVGEGGSSGGGGGVSMEES